MELITQDVRKMIKLLKIIIIILVISPKVLMSADMSGYLLSKAIKEFNNKNYESAYKSLTNIAPTGNPVANYLLGQMYLQGLGIEPNYKIAYDKILYSSQKLFKHDKSLAIESQITLSNMYANGIGTDIDSSKAYMWSFIAYKTSENIHLTYLESLKSSVAVEDIKDIEKKGLKLLKNIIKD